MKLEQALKKIIAEKTPYVFLDIDGVFNYTREFIIEAILDKMCTSLLIAEQKEKNAFKMEFSGIVMQALLQKNPNYFTPASGNASVAAIVALVRQIQANGTQIYFATSSTYACVAANIQFLNTLGFDFSQTAQSLALELPSKEILKGLFVIKSGETYPIGSEMNGHMFLATRNPKQNLLAMLMLWNAPKFIAHTHEQHQQLSTVQQDSLLYLADCYKKLQALPNDAEKTAYIQAFTSFLTTAPSGKFCFPACLLDDKKNYVEEANAVAVEGIQIDNISLTEHLDQLGGSEVVAAALSAALCNAMQLVVSKQASVMPILNINAFSTAEEAAIHGKTQGKTWLSVAIQKISEQHFDYSQVFSADKIAQLLLEQIQAKEVQAKEEQAKASHAAALRVAAVQEVHVTKEAAAKAESASAPAQQVLLKAAADHNKPDEPDSTRLATKFSKTSV